jgi:hypothetical protein
MDPATAVTPYRSLVRKGYPVQINFFLFIPYGSGTLVSHFAPMQPASDQRDLDLRIPSRPLRLSRDLREIPVHKYRLPKDRRKWKAIARERMALAEWLATHGDADGSNIFPGVTRMMDHFGWSRGKLFYLLADLKELRLLESEGLRRERGPRVRRMNLQAFLGAEMPVSTSNPGGNVCGNRASLGAEVQDSREPKSKIRGAEVQSNDGHDRPLTDQSQSQDLRPLPRPSSTPPVEKRKCKKPATPQQHRYAGIVQPLIEKAVQILRRQPDRSYADLSEDLKTWAAKEGRVYSDRWPGAASPIATAIDIALKRTSRLERTA